MVTCILKGEMQLFIITFLFHKWTKDQCYFIIENINTNIMYVLILLAFNFNIFSFHFQVLLILCAFVIFVIKVYFFIWVLVLIILIHHIKIILVSSQGNISHYCL